MNVYVRNLSQEMGRQGWQVDVFTRRHDPAEPQIRQLGENARVIHLEAGPCELPKGDIYHLLPEFVSNLLLFQEKNDLGYDLMHSHYWLSGWVAEELRRRWGVPHIASFHTLGEVKNRARLGEHETELRIETEKGVIAGADQVIAFSPHERDQIVQLYDGLPSKIKVIPAGVDLGMFQPLDRIEARRKLGIPGSNILLYVGRIEPLKGLDVLLQAVACLKERGGWRLLIIGGDGQSDGELARLGSLAAELGINEVVTFMGTVDHETLPLFYNAADICVVPSYYESFGLVAIEALACGIPVVASSVGGLVTTVRDGETGYLIPQHRPEAFAQRLELLLSDGGLRRRLGAAARASVARYSWPLIAQRVLDAYRALAERVQHPDAVRVL
jgi:D-inositol-3-phosphate glycosyltransferase